MRIQYIPSFDLIYNGVGKIVEEICTRIDSAELLITFVLIVKL